MLTCRRLPAKIRVMPGQRGNTPAVTSETQVGRSSTVHAFCARHKFAMVTWNSCGLLSNNRTLFQRKSAMLLHLIRQRVPIICVQEVHGTRHDFLAALRIHVSEYWVLGAQTFAKGQVLTLVLRSLVDSEPTLTEIVPGRVHRVQAIQHDVQFAV